MDKLTDEQALRVIIEREGWQGLMDMLLNIAFEDNLPELYRELDNIAVNYVPEVRGD